MVYKIYILKNTKNGFLVQIQVVVVEVVVVVVVVGSRLNNPNERLCAVATLFAATTLTICLNIKFS